MVSLIKKSENAVPTEIVAFANSARKQQSQQAVNAMHAAVRRLAAAKKGVHAAKEARQTLYKSWSDYLQESIERWQGYAKDFAESESKMVANWEAAVANLKVAKTELEQAQAAATGKSDAEAHEFSEEEWDGPISPAVPITEDVNMLLENLNRMKQKATEASCEEHKTKHRKVEEPMPPKAPAPSGHPPGGGDSFPSQVPFGTPAQQTIPLVS